MELSKKDLKKVDDSLRKVLAKASADQNLRVILTLGDSSVDKKSSETDSISPSDFKSRAEYREALIQIRQNSLEKQFAETRKQLKDASLKLRGGKVSRLIVADGSADDIARSLSIPGIKKVTLDKKFELPKPIKSKSF